MNTTSVAVLTGAVVVAGRWQDGKGMDARPVIGTVGLVLALSLMPEQLAHPFAILVLIAALGRYGIPLFTAFAQPGGKPS